MIVSYSRNFIFIKTKKTAGSTVEAVLAASCSKDDIVTFPSVKYVGLGTDLTFTAPDDEERPGERIRKEREKRRDGGFYSHMPADEAYPKIDPAFWSSATKLTVERHPYEKAVSQAYFRISTKNRFQKEFPAFLDDVVRRGEYAGFPRWSIDGKVVIDEFIRQENLKADLDRVGALLGISIPALLPQFKSKSRIDHRPASEILNDAQKLIVYEHCREEFDILGYER